MAAKRGAHRLPVAARPPVFARTKFLAPQPRDTLVPRPGLVRRLQEADQQPLTIVVGSPGSGKTSLLAEWYRDFDDGTIAWLVADRGDDDPSRFWRGFIRAVQQVQPGFGEEAADLITLDGHVSSDVLESLLVDDGALDERIRLVVDDFHLVSLAAAQQVQHLLDRGLHHLRLLLGSRSDPAVGLHRLRVQGRVCEIREADLRLALDETRELVAKMGLDPDSVDLEALQHRTEGWAAGVQMAALSVVGSDDPASRVRELAGTTQTVAGYLTAEVVANQPRHVQRFLEDTCVVDELDAALTEALTAAVDDAGERVTLEQVEAANLLLHRVDAAGTFFRYHQLFGEMLRHRLQANDPARFRDQHRLAAEHLRSSGDVPGAVRHFWLAGRADLGAQLLREHLVNAYLSTGTPPPVDPSIAPSDEEIRAAPGNTVGYAVGLLLNGHTQLCCSLLRKAHAMTREVEVSRLDLIHITGARIASELSTGNTSEAIELTSDFLTLIEGHDQEDDWVIASIPFGVRAAAWEGRFDVADELLGHVRSRDPRVAGVDMAGVLALLHLERGDIPAAIEQSHAATVAADMFDVAGSGPDVAAHAVLGVALLDSGRLAEAAAEFANVMQSVRLERVPSYVLGSVGLARMQRAQGNFDGALRTLAEARRRLQSAAPGPTLTARLDKAEIAIRLAMGELEAAAVLVDGLPEMYRAVLAKGWLRVLQGRFDETESIVSHLSATARSLRDECDVALLRLRLSIDRGDPTPHVRDDAEVVLDRCQRAGLILPVAEAGTAVLQAVTAAAKRRPRDEYVERLLLTQPLPRPADQARPAFRVDELSSRELIVLRYMATSMTNQEIAEALYLSVNTVKTHIKHVLRKLGATSRVEATRRAQELHYL